MINKTLERLQCRLSIDYIVTFEQSPCIALVFLLLILNKKILPGIGTLKHAFVKDRTSNKILLLFVCTDLILLTCKFCNFYCSAIRLLSNLIFLQHLADPRSKNSKYTLHKKWSFLLRISSVNATKSTENWGFGHIYWTNR